MAGEMDKDGYVTNNEPLTCFQRSNNSGPFNLGYVKGLGRQSTFLFACLAAWNQKQPMSDVFPQLWSTGQKISFVLETHADLTSVALRNAQLSHRGSIRRAHCTITWLGKMLLLGHLGAMLAGLLAIFESCWSFEEPKP